jgi:hypothetical protein
LVGGSVGLLTGFDASVTGSVGLDVGFVVGSVGFVTGFSVGFVVLGSVSASVSLICGDVVIGSVTGSVVTSVISPVVGSVAWVVGLGGEILSTESSSSAVGAATKNKMAKVTAIIILNTFLMYLLISDCQMLIGIMVITKSTAINPQRIPLPSTKKTKPNVEYMPVNIHSKIFQNFFIIALLDWYYNYRK